MFSTVFRIGRDCQMTGVKQAVLDHGMTHVTTDVMPTYHVLTEA